MNAQALSSCALQMVGAGRGLLAMDESDATCDTRLAAAGLATGAPMRRAYRELLLCTPGLNECISGAILADGTIRQQTVEGTSFMKVLADAGIIPGIKVDLGTDDLAGHSGERVTEGLDRLRARLNAYADLGARFAKWRAVFSMGEGTPSCACIESNAQALARFAALCQEAGLVPIVEPELLMEGDHTLAQCGAVTEAILHRVFEHLRTQGVMPEGMILKSNMVLPGSTCPAQEVATEVATATAQCLLRAVPAAVAGIAFLSGGQSAELASSRLNAIHALPTRGTARMPWPLSFSFGRALQQPTLRIWTGTPLHGIAAQKALLHRARCNVAALRGTYSPEMEFA